MGKYKRTDNSYISLSKQFTLIVLLTMLPLGFGIYGVLYAWPAADLLAAVSFLVLRPEFRRMWKEADQQEEDNT